MRVRARRDAVGDDRRGVPIGGNIPIRHWFVLMQENRSFDHYFGTMPGVEGLSVDGMTNPDSSGRSVSTFHETEYCTGR